MKQTKLTLCALVIGIASITLMVAGCGTDSPMGPTGADGTTLAAAEDTEILTETTVTYDAKNPGVDIERVPDALARRGSILRYGFKDIDQREDIATATDRKRARTGQPDSERDRLSKKETAKVTEHK